MNNKAIYEFMKRTERTHLTKKEQQMFSAILEGFYYPYYVLFWLILKTGIRASAAVKLSVGDVYHKEQLAWFNPRSGKYNMAELDATMTSILDVLCSNRKKSEALFLSRRGNEISIPALSRSFYEISVKNMIEPTVTLDSIQRTYLYEYAVKSGSVRDRFNSHISASRSFQKLGVTPPQDKENYIKGGTPQSILLTSNILAETTAMLNESLGSISKELQDRPLSLTTDYAMEVLSYLNDLKQRTENFTKLNQKDK